MSATTIDLSAIRTDALVYAATFRTLIGVDLAAIEGTAIKSTGETGGTKFLREDGDGTCSWQTAGIGGATGATMSRVVTGDTTNLPSIQYAARAQRDSGNTSTANIRVVQTIESVNSIPFAGKTVTFSFHARAGANYSATSSLLNASLYSGTGTDQNALAGFTGSVDVVNQNATLTTSWARYSYTGTVASTATQLGFAFIGTPTGTAGANDFFEITGIQIDIGNVSLPFRTAGVSYQEELAMCQRYLPVVSPADAIGYAYGTNTPIWSLAFPVQARIAPTGLTLIGTFQGYALNTGSSITPAFNLGTVSGASVTAGLTIIAGQGSRLQAQGGATILFTGCEL